jgi:hypothetical protein
MIMGEIARDTDLTQLEGDPAERASVYLQREVCELEAKMPNWLGGATVRMVARTISGSPLATAITTTVVVIAGCLMAGIAATVAAPMWLVITALFAPTGIYATIRIASGRPAGQERDV